MNLSQKPVKIEKHVLLCEFLIGWRVFRDLLGQPVITLCIGKFMKLDEMTQNI